MSATDATQLQQFRYLVLALFRVPIETLRSQLEGIVRQYFDPGQFEMHDGELVIEWPYEGRPPSGGGHLRRALLFEPAAAPRTTAMIANLEDGWSTLVNALAARIVGEHLLVRSGEDPQYPVADLEVWVDGKSERYVGALREDRGWMFHQTGQPRAFEAVECYRKRRVRDRMNRAVLLTCLKSAGWDLDSPHFWQSTLPSVYLAEQRRSSP